MSDRDTVEFVRDLVYQWVGNLMRDADAQGAYIDINDVATALDEVVGMLNETPVDADFEEFLRDLNDGRGTE